MVSSPTSVQTRNRLRSSRPRCFWSLLFSSRASLLSVRGESTQQTGAVMADLDRDGVNDFVLSFRQKAPALVWYRRRKVGWDRIVLDDQYLTVEAGGVVHDVDGDGWPDLIFGGDWQSKEL